MTADLKTYFNTEPAAKAVYDERDCFLVNPKNIKQKKVGGDTYKTALLSADNGGVSGSATDASTYVTSLGYSQWSATPNELYKYTPLGQNLINAIEGNPGNAFDQIKDFAVSAKRQAAVILERLLVGDGTGFIGTVSAESTTSLTMTTDVATRRVSTNQEVEATDSAGNARTGNATVTGINGRVLISDSNWSSQITSLAATDLLYMKGLKTASFTGLGKHFPTTRSGSVTKQGVVISADWQTLAGQLLTGTGSAYEVIMSKSVQAIAGGARPNVLLMSYANFAEVISDATTLRTIVESKAEIGFESVSVRTPAGAIRVVGSPFISDSVIYGLNTETFELAYWGTELFPFTEAKGTIIHHDPAAGRAAMAIVCQCDLVVKNPRDNFVLTIS
jgi:hypothetical protein